MKRAYSKITDRYVEAMTDFSRDQDHATIKWDSLVKGLRIRVGKNRATWSFYAEHRFRGKRSTTCRRLGFWPAMNVKTARKAALMIAGREAAGRIEPGPRAAAKFGEAVNSYIIHLREQSERRGKAATWAAVIELMKAKHFAQWDQWTLRELSDSPGQIVAWHKEVTRKNGPVIANKVVKVMRAVYRNAAKLNRTLPIAVPSSAVIFNPESPRETGVPDFAAWGVAWRRIPIPTRRGYHLFCLLSGCRPGEAARLKWSDVRPKSRAIIIGKSKTGIDIAIPLSLPIVGALRMAYSGAGSSAYVFPAPEGGHNRPDRH